MNRVRAQEAAAPFNRSAPHLRGQTPADRLAPATAGLVIIALSLFGWLGFFAVVRLFIG